MLPSTIVVAVFAVAHAERLNTPSRFMLVGGVSARSCEFLLAETNIYLYTQRAQQNFA